MTVQACLTKHSGFDLETSGLDRFFHQATQVAFTEPAVNLIERTKVFQARIRRCPMSLAEPDALLTTAVPFASFDDKSHRTEYSIAVGLAKWIREQTNTVFHGFNASFDKGFVQGLFYKNLCDPFLMNKGGRTVSDARQTFLASSILDGGIRILRNPDGVWSSTQEAFAAANDLIYGAHDAKEDTAALWKLLGLATISSPELVESLDLTFDKSRLAEAVSRASFYVALAFSRAKGPRLEGRAVIGRHPKYGNQQLAVRLGFLDDRQALERAFQTIATASPEDVKFCRFKANDAPMTILPGQKLMDRLLTPEQQDQLLQIANLARSNTGLYEACCAAEVTKINNYAVPEYPEAQMVSHGFWTDNDMSVARRFHEASPAGKLALMPEMEDDRMQYFAEQIVYSNWPDALPSAALQRLDEYCAWRLRTDDDVPWVTTQKALKRIDELLPTCLEEPKRLLEDYRSALTSLEMNPIQRSR